MCGERDDEHRTEIRRLSSVCDSRSGQVGDLVGDNTSEYQRHPRQLLQSEERSQARTWSTHSIPRLRATPIFDAKFPRSIPTTDCDGHQYELSAGYSIPFILSSTCCLLTHHDASKILVYKFWSGCDGAGGRNAKRGRFAFVLDWFVYVFGSSIRKQSSIHKRWVGR
jgi:hypothetical protein